MNKLQKLKKKIREKMIHALHATPDEKLMKPVTYKVENVQLQTLKVAAMVPFEEMPGAGCIYSDIEEIAKRDLTYRLAETMREQGYIRFHVANLRTVPEAYQMKASVRVAHLPEEER